MGVSLGLQILLFVNGIWNGFGELAAAVTLDAIDMALTLSSLRDLNVYWDMAKSNDSRQASIGIGEVVIVLMSLFI